MAILLKGRKSPLLNVYTGTDDVIKNWVKFVSGNADYNTFFKVGNSGTS